MGESERKSLRDDCIEKGNRQLLSEWDDKKNEGLTPEDVSAGMSGGDARTAIHGGRAFSTGRGAAAARFATAKLLFPAITTC